MLNEYQKELLEALKKAGFTVGRYFEMESGKPKPNKLLSESGKRILDFVGRTCDENSPHSDLIADWANGYSPLSDLIAKKANRIANIIANNADTLATDYGINNYTDILSGKQSEGADDLRELIEELYDSSLDTLDIIEKRGL